MRLNALLLHRLLNGITNGFDLPGGITATDNKVIGKTAYVPRIEQDDINRLLIAGRFNCLSGYVYCFQKSLPKTEFVRLLYHKRKFPFVADFCYNVTGINNSWG